MAAGRCDRSRESGVELVLAANVRERGSWALDGRETKMESESGDWCRWRWWGDLLPSSVPCRVPGLLGSGLPNLQLKPRTSSPSRRRGCRNHHEMSTVYFWTQSLDSFLYVVICWLSFYQRVVMATGAPGIMYSCRPTARRPVGRVLKRDIAHSS